MNNVIIRGLNCKHGHTAVTAMVQNNVIIGGMRESPTAAVV